MSLESKSIRLKLQLEVGATAELRFSWKKSFHIFSQMIELQKIKAVSPRLQKKFRLELNEIQAPLSFKRGRIELHSSHTPVTAGVMRMLPHNGVIRVKCHTHLATALKIRFASPISTKRHLGWRSGQEVLAVTNYCLC